MSIGGGGSVTVGYKYYMGVQLVLSHGPVDKITELIIDDRSAWTGLMNATGIFVVDQPDLFGGSSREGGVQGLVDVLMGDDFQGVDPYLSKVIPGPIPAFRGVTSVVFHGLQPTGGFLWSSMNPYFKAPSFRMFRAARGWTGPLWYSDALIINQRDVNPIHVIFECLTNTAWGMGYSYDDIDDASFRAAALQLSNEGFGISLLWMEQTTINDFIQTVLNHFDGVLRTDVRTGKFKMKLIRNDYNIATVPELNVDNVIELTSFQRVAWGDTANEITVKYTDREQVETNFTVQDLASIQAQGRTIPATREYPGIRDPALAARVAMRDLNVTSAPLSKVVLKCTRVAWDWDISDVFKLAWPRLGLVGVPFRIVKINKGNLLNGEIEIEAVEDIFGLPANAYAQVQAPQWVDTVQPPVPVTAARVFEAPYYDVVQGWRPADIAMFPPGYAFGEIAAVRATSATLNYALMASSVPGLTGYVNIGTADFTPTGTLQADMPRGALPVTFTLNGGFDLTRSLIGEYAYIDDEAFIIDDVALASSTIVARRATLDTVPAVHAAGARVYFAFNRLGYDSTQRTKGETTYYRMLTRTGRGQLPIASATAYSTTFIGRAERPYPPANLQINGAYFPTQVVGQLTAVWAHRDRIQQTAGLVEFRTGNIGPEPGTTYRVQVYQGGTPKRTYLGITTPNWTYPTADAILDGTNTSVRLLISSQRAGLDSWQQHDVTVDRYGFGFRFGQQFGGAVPT